MHSFIRFVSFIWPHWFTGSASSWGYTTVYRRLAKNGAHPHEWLSVFLKKKIFFFFTCRLVMVRNAIAAAAAVGHHNHNHKPLKIIYNNKQNSQFDIGQCKVRLSSESEHSTRIIYLMCGCVPVCWGVCHQSGGIDCVLCVICNVNVCCVGGATIYNASVWSMTVWGSLSEPHIQNRLRKYIL